MHYQKYQPLFWRKAEDSREKQTLYLRNQLTNDDILAFVYETSAGLEGFVFASVRNGRECIIDDFAVADESLWQTVGVELLRAAGEETKGRNNATPTVCQNEPY